MTAGTAAGRPVDLQPIFLAVRQAAWLCQQVQEGHLTSADKGGGHDPVTIADYGSQALVGRAISLAYPEDAVLAEEQGGQFMALVPEDERRAIVRLLGDILETKVTQVDVVKWLDHGQNRQASRTWVIDPIDGTKGFLALRSYVIAVGVMQDGKPLAGVIGAPAYPSDGRGGMVFHAHSGVAYMQPMGGGLLRRIRVSERVSPDEVRALESVEKGHTNHERMARVRERAGLGQAPVHRLDSMEKYARIASGEAELYLRLPRIASTRPFFIWDHLAGTALVEAAGGRVTDVDGSPLDFTRGRALPNRGIIVSNGAIHDRVVEAVMQVLEEEQA